MNPQDPLAALHPLRSPEAIGWWPPAPGWWLLLIAVILIALFTAYLARRRYLANAYRRYALQQLEHAQEAYRVHGDGKQYLGQINSLLKSVALRAYPRSDIASSHGAQWRAFLNTSLPEPLQLQSSFDDAIYRKDCVDIDLAGVHRAALHWIKQHRAAQ